MSTLNALLSKLRDYMKVDMNDQIWTTTNKTNSINVGYSKVQTEGNMGWDENLTTHTFNTVGGVQEYSYSTYLPNLSRVEMVQFTADAGSMQPTNKRNALMNSNSGSAKPSNYYLFGGKIGFYPVPDSGYSITAMYRQNLPKITSTVDSAFDEAFDDAIIKYAAYNIWSSSKNIDKANQALKDFSIAINTLKISRLFNDVSSLSFPFQKGNFTNFSSNKLY